MSSEECDEEYGPARDGRGRFRRGSSGNPRGRPRRQPKVPWSFERSIIDALAETVPVAAPDGTSQVLAVRDVLIKSLVRGAVKAKPKEQLAILQGLAKLNVLVPSEDESEAEEEIWTEEDRRLLEKVKRELRENFCCQCDRPVYSNPANRSGRDDLRFE